MKLPSVCAVMLVNGRPEMAERAVISFKGQTYPNKFLGVLDTSENYQPWYTGFIFPGDHWIGLTHDPESRAKSIGLLRNQANDLAEHFEIILHWDSDDWSHPRRIEEQVALLQASGKDCVGYRDMLFHDERPGQSVAWLYRNVSQRYCIGSSLCYWRRIWEQRPFADLPKFGVNAQGEDDQWHKDLNSLGVSSLAGQDVAGSSAWQTQIDDKGQPRMICSIHGGNTNMANYAQSLTNSPQWKRVPEWDGQCREVMVL